MTGASIKKRPRERVKLMQHPGASRRIDRLSYTYRVAILLGLCSAFSFACAHGKPVAGRTTDGSDVVKRAEASQKAANGHHSVYADAPASPQPAEARVTDDVGPERPQGIGYRKVGTATLRGKSIAVASGYAGIFKKDGSLMIELVLEPAPAGDYAVYLVMQGDCSQKFPSSDHYLLGNIVVGNDASGKKWLLLPSIFSDVDQLAGSTVLVRGEAPESIDRSRGIETLSCGLVEVTRAAQ